MLNINLLKIRVENMLSLHPEILFGYISVRIGFLICANQKLMPRADGPFKVLEKINDNAYKLELPADFGVSPLLTLQI